MKKRVFVTFACMILCFCLMLGVCAKGTPCDHWFIRHNGDGTAPQIDTAFSYLDRYSAYYMDKAANEQGEKVLYLTFDAGYENGNIAKILDVLKEEEVPGAFFILGNLVWKNKDLLVRMKEEGHLVCNHTSRHGDMSRADRTTFEREIRELEEQYREAMGCDLDPFYRPPEGKFVEDNVKWAEELGYTTVLWSFAYPDWDNGRQPRTDWAKEKILSNTHPGEILLLHPTSQTNASIMKELIVTWKQMGYRFASLDNLTK